MKKKEHGNVIDLMACGWVLIFILLILVFYIGYSKAAQIRIQCDTIAKQYLYIMEANGYLKSDAYENMERAFEQSDIRIVQNNCTMAQVAYGSIVKVDLIVEFDNPIASMISEENGFVDFMIVDKFTYRIYMEATAKW